MTPEPAISRPAAFLDRDGTIIMERDYLADPDGVELIPGAINAIQLLNRWGYWVFGVSNQSGVGRGYFDRDAVDAVNDRIIELFAGEKAFINRIYYCPHHPGTDDTGPACDCRKPSPGLIHQAMHDYPVDLSRSFVAGDRQSDIDLGRGVGIPTALVLTGYGREQRRQLQESDGPDLVGGDLLEVVQQVGEMFGLSGASNI